MDQLGGLLLDRGDDLRVAVTGRVDRDAGGEIEEQVAVDVLDGKPVPADRHDRIRARQAGRRPRLIEFDVCTRLRPRQLRDDVRDGTPTIDPTRLGHAHLDTTDGSRLHKGYAEWILAPEYSERPSPPKSGAQPVVRGRSRAASKPTTTPTKPASATGATSMGSELGGASVCRVEGVASALVATGAAALSPDPTTIAPIMPG